jgi:ribose-phosphate pyrophosphokinase
MKGELKIFSGNANQKLASDIAKKIGMPLGKIQVGRFADGEIRVKIKENIRGKDCFVVQSTCPPVNECLMELLIIIDALRRASAQRITAVIPYYGYGRQDRKSEPRVPISAKLIANLIVASGANRVLSIDLHAGQIQGFFDIPVDHLYATPVLLEHFRSDKFKKYSNNLVIVSPDAGGAERARAFAKRLRATLAIIDKRRTRPNQSAVMHVVGEVKGRTAVILDDMIDTGGSLVKAAQALKAKKAARVIAACSHGILSGNALELINSSPIEELIITDSIPLAPSKKSKKITILSVANLLAETIRRISSRESVSSLFA